MDDIKYNEIVCYLDTKTLPLVFSSNKRNFLRKCAKFSLNQKKHLLVEGRIVVRKSDEEKIFQNLHGKSFS